MRTRDIVMTAAAVLIASLIVLAISAVWGPVPHCKIVGNHEIDDHHCIPYCPPDPRECR